MRVGIKRKGKTSMEIRVSKDEFSKAVRGCARADCGDCSLVDICYDNPDEPKIIEDFCVIDGEQEEKERKFFADPQRMKERIRVLYLAGPMTGVKGFNRKRFMDAEKSILETYMTVTVLNPALLPVDLPEDAYMPICLAMLEQADAVAMLPGWGTSRGARLEKEYAEKQGKTILIYREEGKLV